jgi:hypothetical protein
VYSHALEAHATPGLVLEGFHGPAARPGLTAIKVDGPQALVRQGIGCATP